MKLSLWPAVCLFGPRQCGKTTFLKELVFAEKSFTYRTFDKSAVRVGAAKNPELFLATVEEWPLVIDEAHKVPEIFDEVKSLIDESRKPGQFILSGSAKFSKKAGVRESLTGRCAHVYLDAMTLAETLNKESQKRDQYATLADVHRYLERGGMPGVCFLHSKEERASYWESWLETTCELDLKTFSGGRLSGPLARQILECLAIESNPSAHVIAKHIGVDTRRIQSHLEALKDLFVVRELSPLADSEMGKPVYFLFDCGLAHYLGADIKKKFEAYFLNEYFYYAQGAKIKKSARLQTFRSRGGLSANFLNEDHVFFFTEQNTPSKHFFKTVNAFQKRFPKHQVVVFTNGGELQGSAKSRIRMVPWQKIGQVLNE